MEHSQGTFKKQSRYLDSIAIEYKKAAITLANEAQIKKTSLIKEEGGFYSLTDEKINFYRFFKNHVDEVLSKLEPTDKEFLQKDYFNKENSFWWINCYSKSSYYRNKKRVLETFLQFYQL